MENIKPEEPSDLIPSQADSSQEFHEKLLVMNPEPPEFRESPSDLKELTNPPNPNFKPIPELKGELKQMETLYDGLGETEIAAVIAEKHNIIGKVEISEFPEEAEKIEEKSSEKSPKKDEFLAPLPEPSKWERDETAEKVEGTVGSPDKITEDDEESKVVTSEVLKRAENAIFQKAINAIRPIEIKKISDSRKMLYQNPEPKVVPEDPSRKSVNVTINVGKNERNVEIAEPAKKAKLDRSKFKPVPESSPTRLSAKERLGEKVDDEKEKRTSPESEQVRRVERKLSPLMDRRIEPPISLSNSERKVFLDDRKREKKSQDSAKGTSQRSKSDRGRTPPPLKRLETVKPVGFSKHKEEEEEKRKKEKKREEKKRKKEHRSRSKSKDRKRRKEKKHKKDREKTQEKKQKHKEVPKEKEEEREVENEEAKKQRRNPKLVSDRKRSLLDEASFEPDYSASDSESEEEKTPMKKPKLEESEEGQKAKRRSHSSSSEEESSESLSSSSESSSSDESHKKRKKKHKKHKKRKAARRESSSDSDVYSDSSDSSSDEERHRKKKKSKKSKNKKKKKSKHK